MTMRQVTLEATLSLVGPILTKSTTSGRPGVDAPWARTGGAIYLPYSLVRGRLRQSLEELALAGADGLTPADVEEWFGPRAGSAGRGGRPGPVPQPSDRFDPERGLLRFRDFVLDGMSPRDDAVRVRIRMDDARGAADEGALQVLESPFAPGETVRFKGQIEFFARDEAEQDRITLWVRRGLRWTTSFGAGRTIGFGRVDAADVSVLGAPRAIAPVTQATTGTVRLGLKIRLLAPFCVAKYAPEGNLFESDEALAGGILRGVLAALLKVLGGRRPWEPIDVCQSSPAGWEALAAHFDKIRITHAFPAAFSAQGTASRPVVPPLSLVKAKGETGYLDVALCDGPMLLGDPPRAPAFSIDWKDDRDVRRDFGWSQPQREMRVRPAIEPEKRRAKQAQLFAYEMVLPEGYVWLAHLDLKRVPAADRTAVEGQLRSLFAGGLSGIGKTKASATVEVVPAGEVPAPASPDGIHVVTLQTPALLCDPCLLDETSGAAELHQAYQETWDGLAGKALDLIRYFARQRLAGGYLTLRYQPDRPYHPFLLTEAGSVFVLKARPGQEERASECIADWQLHGLPLPQWAVDLYSDAQNRGDAWNRCPFRPQDGFGEIVVDLPCHRDRKPKECGQS